MADSGLRKFAATNRQGCDKQAVWQRFVFNMTKDEPGEWVPKDAFVMPILPPELEVEPLLAALLHLASFLELSSDEAVNPDWAIEALEHVAHYLGSLPTAGIEPLQAQLERVADHGERQGWPEDFTDFAREFLRMAGVGEDEE
jgi:hypothetical protein